MLLPNQLRHKIFAAKNVRCPHLTSCPSTSTSESFDLCSLITCSKTLNNIAFVKSIHTSQLYPTHHLRSRTAYRARKSLFSDSLLQPHYLLKQSYLTSGKAATRNFAAYTRTLADSSDHKGHSQSQSSESETQSGSGENGEYSKQEEKDEHESESKSESNKKKTEDQAPPPPHGDKTPWQVFTETLRSEFKASKEWNESTKALASSAQDFTQNETVKRARSAYSQVSDTATSTTSAALKNTGKAIGQGAAWAWDTSVLQGVRKGANAVGSGIEKVTRPVRETEAFKNVKDVIDDGSSSRYGGWTEKEERKKRREQRELNELAKHGGKRPTVKAEEDPK